MKFCNQCGGTVSRRVPEGDNKERIVCTSCNHVHYVNPLIVVGCLVERDEETLLCRRAIEPAIGKWTLPAGYLEVGETMESGALRETLEEASAAVEIVAPHSQLELTHIGQLHVTYRARMLSNEFAPGIESLECAFFKRENIPWADMAFPAGTFALKFLLEDREKQCSALHQGQLQWDGEGSRFDPKNYTVKSHRKIPLQ